MHSFLIIQTAFIGDVILATAMIEKLHAFYPDAKIDFLLRSGNESLLENNPHLNAVLIWDKKKNKLSNLLRISKTVKRNQYECIINLHRFASSGLIVFLSGAKAKVGFDKNPFSFCYSEKLHHEIGNGKHETERNQQLIEKITDAVAEKPKLYPSESDFKKAYEISGDKKYITISPASVWFTKQFPKHKWIELIDSIDDSYNIYLLGGNSDVTLCNEIIQNTMHQNVFKFAGQLSFLESAALMKFAAMNYVNDSAPCHIASSMNAPVTEIFCSTIPEFGFGPLSDHSVIIQTKEKLDCRPCGIHGFKACPRGHFKCAEGIEIV